MPLRKALATALDKMNFGESRAATIRRLTADLKSAEMAIHVSEALAARRGIDIQRLEGDLAARDIANVRLVRRLDDSEAKCSQQGELIVDLHRRLNSMSSAWEADNHTLSGSLRHHVARQLAAAAEARKLANDVQVLAGLMDEGLEGAR